MVTILKPILKIVTASVTVDEGHSAEIAIESNIDPKQGLVINYTPTEEVTEYLRPIAQNGESKGSGDVRSVSLEFTRATSSSDDRWLATIDLATQFHIATAEKFRYP